MNPMTFAKPRLMRWNDNAITDHNRSDLDVSVERIETSQRMANGTMRKYVIADKRTFSVSWDDLPHAAEYAVDGFWAGREIEAFYNTADAFTLEITEGDGTVNTYTVVFTDFSKSIKKRGTYDTWSLDIEMEEI